MFDQRVFSALKEELERAKQRHEEAKEQFWRMSASPLALPRVTAGVSETDGSRVLRNVVDEENRARTAHLEALKRINEYLLNGTVPEDLGKTTAPGATAHDDI